MGHIFIQMVISQPILNIFNWVVQAPISQNLSSVTNDSFCYKLVKSLLVIGYQQICRWCLSFVIEKRLCETTPRSNRKHMKIYTLSTWESIWIKRINLTLNSDSRHYCHLSLVQWSQDTRQHWENMRLITWLEKVHRSGRKLAHKNQGW